MYAFVREARNTVDMVSKNGKKYFFQLKELIHLFSELSSFILVHLLPRRL